MKIGYAITRLFLCSTLCWMLGVQVTLAQRTGLLRGVVIDPELNEPLPGCVVKVPAADRQLLTDLEGKYEMTLPEGEYWIYFSYISYSTDSYKVSVKANQVLIQNHIMRTEGSQGETVEITATAIQNSTLSVVQEIRTMNVVANAISSDQIALSQDRNVGAIVRRVPGINIIGGQFINIRGLAERYNVVMINDVVAPSNESDKRAFNFGTLPSSLISRIVIYKAASPELVGDFAGGLVRIYTRGIPEKNEISATLQTGFLLGSHFQPYNMTARSSTDLIGFDNGQRSLPGAVPNYFTLQNQTPQQRADIGGQFNNNFARSNVYAGPDVRANFNFAWRVLDRKEIKIGNITSLSYSQTNTNFEIGRRFRYFSVGVPERQADDEQYSRGTTQGVVHNWAFEIKDNHKIEFKNLLNNQSAQTTINRVGIDIGGLSASFRDYLTNYSQRAFYSGQLQGTHKFPSVNLEIDWVGGFNWSNRDEPDWNFLRYIRNVDAEPDEPFVPLVWQAANPNAGYPFRYFFYTQELTYTGALNLKYSPKIGKRFRPTVKAGFYGEYKDRSFEGRRLGIAAAQQGGVTGSRRLLGVDTIFTPGNFTFPNGYAIYDVGAYTDSYTADQRILAGYLALEIPVARWYKIYGGVRIENSLQRVFVDSLGFSQPGNPSSPVVATRIQNVNLERTFFLPSVHHIFTFKDQHQLRLSYAQTVNRPEFREVALFTYYDFAVRDAAITGNNRLKIADIHNVDLRYEFYPNLGEVISIAGFFKYFNNPIEALTTLNTNLEFSVQNVDVATTVGAEVEFRKKLDFLAFGNPAAKNVLQDFTLFGNLTYIYSNIRFRSSVSPGIKDSGRPLQGQAPYLVNVGLTYDSKRLGLATSIQYNIVGPYLVTVGSPVFASLWEVPRNSLDITFRKSIGKYFNLLLGAENLLNAVFQQNVDQDYNFRYSRKGDPYFYRYHRGQYLSVGLQFRY